MGNPSRRHPRFLYRDQLESLLSTGGPRHAPVPGVAVADSEETEQLPCADFGPLVSTEAGAGVGQRGAEPGPGD